MNVYEIYKERPNFLRVSILNNINNCKSIELFEALEGALKDSLEREKVVLEIFDVIINLCDAQKMLSLLSYNSIMEMFLTIPEKYRIFDLPAGPQGPLKYKNKKRVAIENILVNADATFEKFFEQIEIELSNFKLLKEFLKRNEALFNSNIRIKLKITEILSNFIMKANLEELFEVYGKMKKQQRLEVENEVLKMEIDFMKTAA